MQFQVPQNITMEDRIVGPLTAIQFGIVVIGGGISFFLATSQTIPSPLNQLAGLTMAAVTLVLAVGKFNDQPMYRFIRSIYAFVVRPRIRVWHKSGKEVQLIKPNPQTQAKQAATMAKKVTKDDIARLALVLDSRGSQGVTPKIQTQPAPSTPPAKEVK